MIDASVAAPARSTVSFTVLAGQEVRRYLRSPIFLAGLVAMVWTLASDLRSTIVDANSRPISPVVLIATVGLVTAFRLTHSMQRSAEALDVAPTPLSVRTAALCVTAIVPFAAGVASTVAILAYQRADGSFTYGAFSPADRVVILAGQVAVPCLGAPLLGIALARWVRFPWTVIIVVLLMNAWVVGINGLAATYRDSFAVVLLRMFAPFTFFTAWYPDRGVETWRGSPSFFLAWQLCLCSLAVIVALLRGAAPPLRERLLRALGVMLAVAALMYVLAATGGLGHAIITSQSGTVRPI